MEERPRSVVSHAYHSYLGSTLLRTLCGFSLHPFYFFHEHLGSSPLFPDLEGVSL